MSFYFSGRARGCMGRGGTETEDKAKTKNVGSTKRPTKRTFAPFGITPTKSAPRPLIAQVDLLYAFSPQGSNQPHVKSPARPLGT